MFIMKASAKHYLILYSHGQPKKKKCNVMGGHFIFVSGRSINNKSILYTAILYSFRIESLIQSQNGSLMYNHYMNCKTNSMWSFLTIWQWENPLSETVGVCWRNTLVSRVTDALSIRQRVFSELSRWLSPVERLQTRRVKNTLMAHAVV